MGSRTSSGRRDRRPVGVHRATQWIAELRIEAEGGPDDPTVALGLGIVADIPPHVHPGQGFTDLDVSDHPDLRGWHVAYRFGPVGEESFDAAAPFIPLSLSYSERKVPASMRTIKYGMMRDFWKSSQEPGEKDRQALLRSALSRLASDISRFEAGDESIRTTRQFVLPR